MNSLDTCMPATFYDDDIFVMDDIFPATTQDHSTHIQLKKLESPFDHFHQHHYFSQADLCTPARTIDGFEPLKSLNPVQPLSLPHFTNTPLGHDQEHLQKLRQAYPNLNLNNIDTVVVKHNHEVDTLLEAKKQSFDEPVQPKASPLSTQQTKIELLEKQIHILALQSKKRI